MGYSQSETQNLSRKELRKERPAYLNITAGISSSGFRDFGTSPLFYKGKPLFLSVSCNKIDEKRESEIGLSYSFGNYKNSFNNHEATSVVRTLSLFYYRLYQLNKLSSEKLSVKIGGLFNTTANLRINPSLQNNAMGLEVIPTLFGSVKAQIDLSRKEAIDKKFLFINYKLKPKKRNLALSLNIGLMNNSYRNGYVYSGQSEILNLSSIKYFDHYQFDVFSGFRISSAIDYTVWLKNKNAVQFSYLWDAYKTRGDFDKFEMVLHTFKLTLMFNTNNK